jgi:fibro-slime domain-containing protein
MRHAHSPHVRALVVIAALAGLALNVEAGPPGGATKPTTGLTSGASPAKGATSDLPATLNISATIRDFKPYNAVGGHPDFESFSGGVRVGLLATQLDADGKPVVASLTGQSLNSEFRDSKGNAINPALYDPSKGDTAGSLSLARDNRITSVESFAQWYRDIPGTNAATSLALTFNRVPGTSVYVFDSANDAPYKARGGFFPIDGQLYGNYANTGHNFHFTTELEAGFTYHKNSGQVFTFTGDDDVWVFINNSLVVDLGGVHTAHTQSIDLDRLGLDDGAFYPLKVFHAERHTTQSNFRIETTIQLRTVSAPTASALAD